MAYAPTTPPYFDGFFDCEGCPQTVPGVCDEPVRTESIVSNSVVALLQLQLLAYLVERSAGLSPLSANQGVPTEEAGVPTANSSNLNTAQPNYGTVEDILAAVLPTEQLVQLLNQRLQNHRWEEGEPPPGYPADGPV